MPAPIEAFHEENDRHKGQAFRTYGVELGSAALAIAGIAVENDILTLSGTAVFGLAYLKLARDRFQHEQRVDILNMERTGQREV